MTKEEKRREILEAAIRVISVMGFEGAKIEDIAKEAEVGKGTIYEYFASKNTLYVEMLRYGTLRFREGLVETLAGKADIAGKISGISQYNSIFFKAHSLLLNSVMAQQVLPKEVKEEIRKDCNSIFKIVENEIKKAIDSQMIRPGIDVEVAAAVIIGGINYYAMRKLFDDSLAPEEMDHMKVAEVILSGWFKS